MDEKIKELKKEILDGDFSLMDSVVEVIKRNKVIYSDNYGNITKEEKEMFNMLVPFMHLLYRGSKHSKGTMCENGFIRIVEHNGVYLKFEFYSGPETFVSVEETDGTGKIKPLVTMELLRTRLQEAEDVKNELAPIIEKYLKAGLTFEEITKMFVEIMRENRIHL